MRAKAVVSAEFKGKLPHRLPANMPFKNISFKFMEVELASL